MRDGAGAPRKLSSPALRVELLALLRVGVSREDACDSLGISSRTLRNEIGRDAEFKSAVREAETASIVAAVQCVNKAAIKDPKFALAVLERRRPKEWAKKKSIAITAKPPSPVLAPELLAELLTRLGASPLPPSPAPPLLLAEAPQDAPAAPSDG